MSTTLRLTYAEYDAMVQNGAFGAIRDRRIEFIHGELTETNPPGARHEYVVDKIAKWSYQYADETGFWVRVQNSIGLPDEESAPQPDVAWADAKNYAEQRPQAGDVRLLLRKWRIAPCSTLRI